MRGSPEEIERDFAAIDAKITDLTAENERLRDLLSHIQHYTSCTSHQFELIEQALSPNDQAEPRAEKKD